MALVSVGPVRLETAPTVWDGICYRPRYPLG